MNYRTARTSMRGTPGHRVKLLEESGLEREQGENDTIAYAEGLCDHRPPIREVSS